MLLLWSASAERTDHQLDRDGSRGLKRGVHLLGNRVSYGHFLVEKMLFSSLLADSSESRFTRNR